MAEPDQDHNREVRDPTSSDMAAERTMQPGDDLDPTLSDMSARPTEPILPGLEDSPVPVVSSGPVPAHFFRQSPSAAPSPPGRSAATADEPASVPRAPSKSRERLSLRQLRAQARRVWGETTSRTTGTSMLSTSELDLRHSRAVVDLAGRVAATALGAGATAADATALLLRVTIRYKLSVHADVTMSAVTITHFRSLESDPITVLRTVRGETTDYRKLEAVEELVDEITRDGLDLTEARKRIARIVQMPRTYRRWVQTLSKGLLGFWVTALFGGGWWECLIAGLTTATVDLAMRGVHKLRAPSFFGQVAGAAVCAAVALLVMWARSVEGWNVTVSPSLIVAAGMISMLAGLSLTTAARDAIDGYFVTAAARFVQVATQTGGIVLGLTGTLWIGLELGVPAYLSPTTGVRPLWWIQVIASALIAVSFAVNNHLPPRAWFLAAGFGLLSWAVASGAGQRVATAAAAAAAAAFVAGVLAEAVSRIARVPATALVTAGVVSLVPGMALYRGLLGLVQLSQGAAVPQDSGLMLFQAVTVAVMLAAGASLGSISGRPLSLPKDWQGRLALGRARRSGREEQE